MKYDNRTKLKSDNISEDMCETNVKHFEKLELSQLKEENDQIKAELTKYITNKDRLLADIEILKTQLDSVEWQKKTLEKQVREKDMELEIHKNKLNCSEEIVTNLKRTVQNFKGDSNMLTVNDSFDKNESANRNSIETQKNERISAEVLEYYSMWVNDKRNFEKKVNKLEYINDSLKTKLQESLLTVVRLTEEVKNFEEYTRSVDFDYPEEDKLFENVDRIVHNKEIITSQKEKYNLTKSQYRKSQDFNHELLEDIDNLETNNNAYISENKELWQKYKDLFVKYNDLQNKQDDRSDVKDDETSYEHKAEDNNNNIFSQYIFDNIPEDNDSDNIPEDNDSHHTQNVLDNEKNQQDILDNKIEDNKSEHTQNVFDCSFESVNMHKTDDENIFYQSEKKSGKVSRRSLIENNTVQSNGSEEGDIVVSDGRKTFGKSDSPNIVIEGLDQIEKEGLDKVDQAMFDRFQIEEKKPIKLKVDNSKTPKHTGFDLHCKSLYSPRVADPDYNFKKFDGGKQKSMRLGLETIRDTSPIFERKKEDKGVFGNLMSQLGCGGGH